MSGLKRPAPVNPEETAIEPAEKRIKVDPEHSPTSTSASTNPSLFIKTNSPVDDTPEIELSGILSKPTALQKLLALAVSPSYLFISYRTLTARGIPRCRAFQTLSRHSNPSAL